MATVSGQQVADYLARGNDTAFIVLAAQHVEIVTAYVRAYTRGEGFDPVAGEPDDELGAVITAATARLVLNPAMTRREGVGDYQVTRGTLEGFTLIELAVLHRYRRRLA